MSERVTEPQEFHPAFTAAEAEAPLRPELFVEPVREDYAYIELRDGFDWHGIFDQIEREEKITAENPLYVVNFDSVLKEDLTDEDIALLIEHDRRAHEAGLESPALLHYFADNPDEDGVSRSFCIWRSRKEGHELSKDQRHEDAKEMTRMYETWSATGQDVYRDGDEIVFRMLFRVGSGE